jgi:hypothetical protein
VLTGGYTLAFSIATGFLVTAVLIVALVIQPPAAQPALTEEEEEERKAPAYADAAFEVV